MNKAINIYRAAFGNSSFGKILALLIYLTCSSMLSFADDFPAASKTLVTDFTKTLSAAQVQQLERKLVHFDDSTSTQIAVVIMNSVGGYDIADYAVRLAQKWGIGNKKYNNGILLLVALGDRAVTIQTGYGVEAAVPDAIAYQIIEQDIKPAFSTGNYYQGLDQATNSLISYTKGEYQADPKVSGEGAGGSIIGFIIIIIIIIAIFARRGGGGNGGGRVMGGRGANDLFWWTLLNSLGGGRGNNDSGGFGGGGGGGFGGFGGGGFGGGGASGRW